MSEHGHGIPPNNYNAHSWIINNPEIGEDCWIGAFTVVDGIGGLKIGKGCTISCGAHIVSHSSARRCVTERRYPLVDKQAVVIEEHVFIGENATILMGCVIGHHSIIAAGAVVLEGTSVPPYSLVVGVPARIVRSIEEEVKNLSSAFGEDVI